ncbi:DMT family transporter [Leifsonia shinshuensis]|uniref:DMT family transporter n=1 Tax=Leifsonia shinshuensis TaxID=150026 RepID=UPI001F50651B|nr:DMT family transporter [Leifsonia shinshuensis]MCI0157274.1 DMT family transporter [Leifsonia shinshuensis]
MKRSWTGTGAVLLAGVLWGTTGTAASFAPAVPPIAIGAFAMGVGGILQGLIAVPALWASRRRLRPVRGLVALGAVSVAVYPLAFYASMRLAGVAVGTVITIASAPIFSAVLERLLDKAPLSGRWYGSAALAIIGSAALCFSRLQANDSGAAATLSGVGLGLVAGATYALYTWAVQRLMRRGVERPAAMGAVFGLGGLALIPVLVATGEPILDSPATVSVAIYMALVPMFLGYVLFGIGLARVRASSATILTLCEPAVAAILAVAVVGERLSPLGWSGLALIGAGLVVLTVRLPGVRTVRA